MTGKKEKSFFVGRGNTVDIRITDISVSRVHSEIKLVNGEFYLSDKDAKFGTLVLIQEPISLPITEKQTLGIQIGKHFLRFSSSFETEGFCLSKKSV